MKTQTLVLIIAAGALGVAIMAGMTLVVAWQLLDQPAGGFAQPGVRQQPLPFILPEATRPLPPADLKTARGKVMKAEKISGPFTHGNLSVFLFHGKDTIPARPMLALHEAINQNLAVVHDTRMNDLSIDNRSDADIFLQSGDIVKGGTQDRTIQYDLLVPARASGVTLAAFCVEQGRSGPRGFESSAVFQSSTEQLPGKQLRLANLYRRSQWDIWSGVRQMQTNLSRSVGDSVRSAQSETSMQLTLENQRVLQ
jgi:hypothetical protein